MTLENEKPKSDALVLNGVVFWFNWHVGVENVKKDIP
jgi:hypothetical protein